MGYKKFYKVVVLSVDLLETTIDNEKHFGSLFDAIKYKQSVEGRNNPCLIFEVGADGEAYQLDTNQIFHNLSSRDFESTCAKYGFNDDQAYYIAKYFCFS